MEGGLQENTAIPFSSLCPILKSMLAATGKRGSRAIEHLMDAPFLGSRHHLGTERIQTPCGSLRLDAVNVNDQRQINISLQMTPNLSYVHGEVAIMGPVVPHSIAASYIGQPLSALCETRSGFPGAEHSIENIRCFTRSTRIRIAKERASMTFADFCQ